MFDYTIRDVDKKLLITLKNKLWTVRQDGKDVRFRIAFNTVDEALGRETFPAISISSGEGLMAEETEWNQNRPEHHGMVAGFKEDPDDTTQVITNPGRTDFTYQYVINYLVTHKSHDNFIKLELFKLFPRTSIMFLNRLGEKEAIVFRRIGEHIDLTAEIDGKKIYRKQFTLQTHLRIQLEEAQKFLRAHAGRDFTTEVVDNLDEFADQFS